MSKETKPSGESRDGANCASTKSKEESPGKNTHDDSDFDFLYPPIDPKEIGKTDRFRRR